MGFIDKTCLNVCITADICNAIFPEHRDKRRWDQIMCSAIRLHETISPLLDDFANPPRMTWFVRADPMMRRIFTSETFLLERHGAHFSRLRAAGHEIGWHPHLEFRNLKMDIEELPAIATRVRRYFPVTSVRIGEAFHSTGLMRLIANLGFTVDSTALPGRFNHQVKTPFDWRGAPECPYNPSQDDYRKAQNQNGIRIVEVPFTMLPLSLPGDTPGPSARYMNLSYKRDLFSEACMAKYEWPTTIVAIVHPAELTPPAGHPDTHRILSFNENEPVRNLKFLVNRLRSLGRKIRYCTLKEIPPMMESERIWTTFTKGDETERVRGWSA